MTRLSEDDVGSIIKLVKLLFNYRYEGFKTYLET